MTEDRRGANRTARPGLALAAGLLLAALAAPPPGPTSARRSSPAWPGARAPPTAASRASPSCAAAPLDAVNVYLAPPSFPDMVTELRRLDAALRHQGAALVVAMALLPAAQQGPVRPVRGRRVRRLLPPDRRQPADAGAQGIVVRLGWEANIGSDSHPWGVDSADQVPAYKACWRRAAAGAQGGRAGPQRRVDQRQEDGNTACTCSTCTRATTWSTCGACTTTTPARRRARRRSGTNTTTPPTTAGRGASALGWRRPGARQEAGRGRVGHQAAAARRRPGGRSGVHGQHVPVLPRATRGSSRTRPTSTATRAGGHAAVPEHRRSRGRRRRYRADWGAVAAGVATGARPLPVPQCGGGAAAMWLVQVATSLATRGNQLIPVSWPLSKGYVVPER